MNNTQQSIIVVDNDNGVLSALQSSLCSVSDNISIFSSPVKCLKSIKLGEHDLLITDINMPEMDGITLMKHSKEIDPGLAMLVITGYGDISLAVKAVKMGADEFIEKPFGHLQITEAVKKILAKQLAIGRDDLRRLTKAEIVILTHIVEGYGNAGIANKLSRSIRTVEGHRSNLMAKLKVDNIVDLVQKANDIGIKKPD